MGCNLWAKFAVHENEATVEEETAGEEESPTPGPSESDVV